MTGETCIYLQICYFHESINNNLQLLALFFMTVVKKLLSYVGKLHPSTKSNLLYKALWCLACFSNSIPVWYWTRYGWANQRFETRLPIILMIVKPKQRFQCKYSVVCLETVLHIVWIVCLPVIYSYTKEIFIIVACADDQLYVLTFDPELPFL